MGRAESGEMVSLYYYLASYMDVYSPSNILPLLCQVQVMSIQQEVTGRATQQELERQMAGLRNDVQVQSLMLRCCFYMK